MASAAAWSASSSIDDGDPGAAAASIDGALDGALGEDRSSATVTSVEVSTAAGVVSGAVIGPAESLAHEISSNS